ncbi:hypothetical protein O7606_24540 [Micromonospora sp. WMMD882]|uniref:hypothetical protein n=1 Tax=Micromonospora sp. WMMD882 TaxID=3015151 RepID=UPI00248C795F|nr:hypothetical protein [Micromonospora sp. WMMD882]WBB79301.1 hypothetical protein O7606_24540 [Micromonospora sp. WMMD882]
MRIDDNIENQVRDTLHWVVKQDPGEFGTALQSFQDQQSRLAALELLLQVCAIAAVDVFGHKPDANEVAVLADKIARTEQWSRAEQTEIASLLRLALSRGQPAEQAHLSNALILAFLVAGNLLSSKPQLEGKWWFDYLDSIEAAIEAKR